MADPPLIWSILGTSVTTTQIPACGYTETLTSSTTSPIITITSGASISYTAYTSSVNDVGDHFVTITSTLNNYPYSPPIASQSTFTLTVAEIGTNVDDLCTTTSVTIAPAKIETLVAFAGYTTSSQSKYTFTDVVSISHAVYPDFCGEKQIYF